MNAIFFPPRKYNATQFEVYCMDIVESEKQQINVHQIDSQNTSEIVKLISGYTNSLILWFENDEIESRWYNAQSHQITSDRKQFYNVTSLAAEQFDANNFVAVCMRHRSNTTKALIRIYR